MSDNPPLAASIIFEHIYAHIPIPNPSTSKTSSPLFVALQGPQGSGKTFLTEHVKNLLSLETERHPAFRVATLSIDDLYLPHANLKELASANPKNALLRGRGQPGTHDIELGLSLLHSLKEINLTQGDNVRIPRFDKSLFDGEGDRLPECEWTFVQGPLDVVLLEGWCVGFYPQWSQYIEQRINEVPLGLEEVFNLSVHSLEHILDINQRLADYTKWWDLFDIFVQIAPPNESPYVHIYKWRLQQEHAMMASNGGKGMTDEQVKKFIDRYIPGYHFFGSGVVAGGYDQQTGLQLDPPWLREEGPLRFPMAPEATRCLRITIDENRTVSEVAYCRR
ncbi:P-loop containing nucleoside triphosphate hydrolase protein [Multifurca ochricompacta]|uniref:P-loop containing nucleoside triphosphate hydrolase protein n=1 Tax=Multifurca ochricompacta TaxID=376703 RepID=A0AAD4M5T2_9AGAM|nr:P-loop containing nucleoside triphosphate hydrolase protein [Multifurca ochricompacta]